jgi:hypothetical protein
MHEAALMNEFLEGFKNSKECNGITFYLKTGKKPDFTVQITAFQNNRTVGEQAWTWILGYPGDQSPADKPGHGIGGMGIQSTVKLTARDVLYEYLGRRRPESLQETRRKNRIESLLGS